MDRESKKVLHRPRVGLVIHVALPPLLFFCPRAGAMTASSPRMRLTRSAFIKAIWHSSLGHVSSDQSTKNDFNLPGLGAYSTQCILAVKGSTLENLHARFSNLVLRLVRTLASLPFAGRVLYLLLSTQRCQYKN